MEFNYKKLQNLTEKAWVLHDRLDDQINNTIGVCNLCSHHGRYCHLSGQTEFQDRQPLIAIRDSLKELQTLLLHLQRVQSWQVIDRNAAVSLLEESRGMLIEQVTKYKGREVGVIEELKASFGNKKSGVGFNWNTKEIRGEKNFRKKKGLDFLIDRLKALMNFEEKRKWVIGVGLAIKLLLLPMSLSSAIHYFSQRRTLLSNIPNTPPLDVFCGRG